MISHSTNVPVLLVVFKRPDTATQVFAAIRKARPRKLYVAADGPRLHRRDEQIACALVRDIVTRVDWECEVQLLFRDENLGSRLAVSSAINWFFEHEEAGIILEDDCLPSPSFFRFCEELLVHYRNDEKVMMISGNNFQAERRFAAGSYYISKYTYTWGWATWRRAWALFDLDMKQWPAFRESGALRALSDGNRNFEPFWRHMFDALQRRYVDAWDYAWLLTCWTNGGLSCVPSQNLVKNIGFGKDATNTTDPRSWMAEIPLEELEFPLRHPAPWSRSTEWDAQADTRVYGISSLSVLKQKLAARFPALYALRRLSRARRSKSARSITLF